MRLFVLEGPAARDAFEVHGPRVLIGRAPDCDVVVFDAQVSRHHAQLLQVGDGYVVEGIQQQNPTIINDQFLQGRRALAPGDLIVVGGVVLMVEAPPRRPSGPPRPSPSQAPTPLRRQAHPEIRQTPSEGETAFFEIQPGDLEIESNETLDIDPSQIPAFGSGSRFSPLGIAGEAVPVAPPPPPSAEPPAQPAAPVLREITGRLAAIGQRIKLRGEPVREKHPDTSRHAAALDIIVANHERLGGDHELARLAGLLSERLANQTDISALYRLGMEADTLAAWCMLARRSVEESTRLAQLLARA